MQVKSPQESHIARAVLLRFYKDELNRGDQFWHLVSSNLVEFNKLDVRDQERYAPEFCELFFFPFCLRGFINIIFIFPLPKTRKLRDLIRDDAEEYNEECGHDVNLSDDELSIEEQDEPQDTAEDKVARFTARISQASATSGAGVTSGIADTDEAEEQEPDE